MENRAMPGCAAIVAALLAITSGPTPARPLIPAC
jgi:hypothetical protein